MTAPLVTVLYNKPLLPKSHPDYWAEEAVVEMAETMAKVLEQGNFRTRLLGLGNDPAEIWEDLRRAKPDVFFNLHEGQLENTATESYVMGLLQWTEVPFTGSPYLALTLARPKHIAKTLLRGAGLPTPEFFVVEELPVPVCTLEFPVIVKAAEQDASVSVEQGSVCTNQFQLEERVAYVLKVYGPPALVEQYVPGREINVALTEFDELRCLPPSEILFKQKTGTWPILTYTGKWEVGSEEYADTPPKVPADIPARLAKKLNAIAMKAYRLIGCRDYARVDFRVTPEGKPYILEVNPNPDLSEDAGFARSLAAMNIRYADFIIQLVTHAMTRPPAPRGTFNALPRHGAVQMVH